MFLLNIRRFDDLLVLEIRAIDRKQEVPHDGPMCDLLWSDPDGELSSNLSNIVELGIYARGIYSRSSRQLTIE